LLRICFLFLSIETPPPLLSSTQLFVVVDYCIESYKMSHDDLPVSAVAQASNSKSKNVSNNKNTSNRHTKQDMKMTKSPSHAVIKQEQALNSKSALRPAKQQQQQQSLPHDTPVKSKRLAPSGSDLSDYLGQQEEEPEQQQPQRHQDDTAKEADCQQTPVTTGTDDESVLENATLTIEDLEAKIRQVRKLIKLAKRNTAKDQEAACRMVRENETLENELDMDGTNGRPSSPGKQTVEGLTAACAKARQKLLDKDQAIAKMDARLGQVLAEADVLAKQVSLAEMSVLVDPSTTDTTSTKFAETTTAATDDDDVVLAEPVEFAEVSVLVDPSTNDTTSSKVADTTIATTDDEDEPVEHVDLDEVSVLVDQSTTDITSSNNITPDTTTAAKDDGDEDEDNGNSSSSSSSSNNSSESDDDDEIEDIDIDDDSSSNSSSESDESYQGFIIPQLPVYTPGAE
jgi:hypothetical protein